MAKEKKVWKIGVDVDCYTVDNNDGEDSNEPYHYRGTTSTSWHVNGLKLIEEGKSTYGYHETVEVNVKPIKGKLYHLLYAVYSTGDSFGHDEGKCFEIVGLYKSRKTAEENEKRLIEGKPVSTEKTWGADQICLKFEGTSKIHKYYRPWMGYFERLVRLEVLSLMLN